MSLQELLFLPFLFNLTEWEMAMTTSQFEGGTFWTFKIVYSWQFKITTGFLHFNKFPLSLASHLYCTVPPPPSPPPIYKLKIFFSTVNNFKTLNGLWIDTVGTQAPKQLLALPVYHRLILYMYAYILCFLLYIFSYKQCLYSLKPEINYYVLCLMSYVFT